MKDARGVNRRSLMKGMAGTAVAPAVLGSAALTASGAAVAPEATVAVTVVRATHSRSEPNALRIGVRASIRSADVVLDGTVLVIEPVAFGISATDAGDQIAKGVRSQVAEMLDKRELATDPDRIAVQVFGGVL